MNQGMFLQPYRCAKLSPCWLLKDCFQVGDEYLRGPCSQSWQWGIRLGVWTNLFPLWQLPQNPLRGAHRAPAAGLAAARRGGRGVGRGCRPVRVSGDGKHRSQRSVCD